MRYLAIALLTYRRLRPSSRCSQSSVNTGERFFSRRFFCEETFKHSVSKHLSDALDYSLRYPTSGSPELASSANRMSQPTATTQDPLRAAAERSPQAPMGNDDGGAGGDGGGRG